MSVLKTTNSFFRIEMLRLTKAESRLFTGKELKIIKKMLDMEPLTAREANRYSRTIKPKINAVIDFYNTALLVRNKE
jgi:hypothetical protein